MDHLLLIINNHSGYDYRGHLINPLKHEFILNNI
jgi:hypothetical protein